MHSPYRSLLLLVGGLFLGASFLAVSAEAPREEIWANTFSIAAYDAENKEWGVATASKVLAVGNCVPWAQAKAGAIATQSAVNVTYGPNGLKLLAEGKSAQEVLKELVKADDGREVRQAAIVDRDGNVASFTGKMCVPYAGGKEGKGYVCVGNLLASEAVVADMAKAYEDEKGPLAWRLLAAMEAGEKAGGDKRGKQSAAVLIVREGHGPNGFGDRKIDLRVDDHETPIKELARLLAKTWRRPAR